eukprot:8297790-Ditylum_brightwellii.AAC.2
MSDDRSMKTTKETIVIISPIVMGASIAGFTDNTASANAATANLGYGILDGISSNPEDIVVA